ncbi:AlbA family DNA-binding domain-containing protein [Porphyromonas levii]|uniref:AlbA family DNA-binding domain-containing protein n=1 Tax=Porphyromonas levii TaxID=28114 RepID=UPI001B8CD4BC|nr:ATP-binding protein [Porphyromonas levii]MBR8729413.1 hypothetical protein [Porphyromonas levii]MBR8730970.1 hypothetical protein [Porphyromonas levii]MBR8759069.1 hypothetical protein [Porphyromonas levii]MBR8762964.1 hypothetical protein [Porphyromonas levii]MBR8784449.1 hypothetical protein [Porphyromonas levii]
MANIDISKIIAELNCTQETSKLEVKRGSEVSRATMESVCSFSNEPNLNGGIILLGIDEIEIDGSIKYDIVGVREPDKLQKDLTTSCATVFNIPIRPRITIQDVQGKEVIAIIIYQLRFDGRSEIRIGSAERDWSFG